MQGKGNCGVVAGEERFSCGLWAGEKEAARDNKRKLCSNQGVPVVERDLQKDR